MRGKTGSSRGPFFMPSIRLGGAAGTKSSSEWTKTMTDTNNQTPDNQMTDNQMTGAEIVLKALKDNGVEHIFGYPGGAVLPIYDEIFQQDDIQHILVRHEQ